MGCCGIPNKIAAWVLQVGVLVKDDLGMSSDSGKPVETPQKAKGTGDSEDTPEKLGTPANIGIKSRYALEKPERKQKVETPIAYFDFGRRVAYMSVNGERLESFDWFLSRPALGDKSPVHVNFLVHSKTVVAHLHGIWPGALAIGTEPGTNPKQKPGHSPTCRIWKAIRS